MPGIILKCRYIKNGKEHLSHLVRYIATREGAEPARDTHLHLPATIRQKQAINEILQAMPETEETHEYQDYKQNPTMGNASEFLSTSMEQNMDLIAKKKNYVDYIAKRPGVEKMGTHGLFTDAGRPVILSRIQDEVSNHEGNVWTCILSLRREDAERLGYGNVKSWEALLRSRRNQMAEAMKIPPEDLVWYAAFHNEGHHPHVHIIAYSSDPAKGFLTTDGIGQMRAMYAKEIFHQERYELYQKQTGQRDELVRTSRDYMRNLCGQMKAYDCQDIGVEQKMLQLSGHLKKTKGKKVYGYLSPGIKQLVDRIVDELEAVPAVAACYQAWYESRLDILHTYTDDSPPLPPLSGQKEFKQIRNMVIQEAMALEHTAGGFPASGINGMDQTIMENREDVPDKEPEKSSCLEESVYREDVPYEIDGHASWTKAYKTARKMLYGTGTQKPDFAAAYQMMTVEAERGNAFAMCDLGHMIYQGLGCGADPDASEVWYKKALQVFRSIERGKESDYIEYRIGKLYAAGLGTEQDYKEAAVWFEASSRKNNPYAKYSLGMLYRQGQGVERDDGMAASLLKESMLKGNPYAAWEYGLMLSDGTGVEKDVDEARDAFRTAFCGFVSLEEKLADDKLQYRIGRMYQEGTGVGPDEEQAVQYFKKAVDRGNIHAMRALADIYLTTGKPELIHQGILLLEGAAEADDSIAMYRLGIYYLQGGSIGKAMEWLEKSAGHGNHHAEYRMGRMFQKGEGVEPNLGVSLYWLNLSAGHGNQYAQYMLGKTYLFNRESGMDRQEGIFWLMESASQGNPYAIYLLEHKDRWVRMEIQCGVIRLFHQLSGIFEEQIDKSPGRHNEWIDRKRRRKLKEKKIAQGIR